jgi:hypothetical protein
MPIREGRPISQTRVLQNQQRPCPAGISGVVGGETKALYQVSFERTLRSPPLSRPQSGRNMRAPQHPGCRNGKTTPPAGIPSGCGKRFEVFRPSFAPAHIVRKCGPAFERNRAYSHDLARYRTQRSAEASRPDAVGPCHRSSRDVPLRPGDAERRTASERFARLTLITGRLPDCQSGCRANRIRARS